MIIIGEFKERNYVFICEKNNFKIYRFFVAVRITKGV